MNKKELRNIIKGIKGYLKNDESVSLRFNPTLEDCDYLYSKGLNITRDNSIHKRHSMFVDMVFNDSDYLLYSLEC